MDDAWMTTPDQIWEACLRTVFSIMTMWRLRQAVDRQSCSSVQLITADNGGNN